MINIYYKSVTAGQPEILTEFKKDSWLAVENPSEEELSLLQEKFALDGSILRDALDPYEIPRLENENGLIYFITRIPFRDNGFVHTMPILIVQAPDFIMTFCRTAPLFLESFIKNSRADFLTTHKTRAMAQFFAEITKSYNTFLVEIRKESMSLGVKLENIDNKTIVKLVNFEEILNDFLTALTPTSVALEKFLSAKMIVFSVRDQARFEDLIISKKQLIELCKASLNSIVNIREAYSTIITNNLNRVIKFLTSITVILMIPTIIASLYGMNVRLPFDKTTHAFSLICLIIVVCSILLTRLFQKKNWL
jgi:magnesium transporter